MSFLAAVNWMRTHLPDYSRVGKPLQDLLQEALKGRSKRDKVTAASVKIEGLWNSEHDKAFEEVEGLLISGAVKLSYPDLDKIICVFTDASDIGWGALITQVPRVQEGLNPNEQDHEPLVFLGGLFRGSELNWSVIDKEANALIKPFQKQTWMLEGRRIWLYTDHLNLKYIFSTETETAMKRSTSYRLQGYADLLKRFDYNICHIQGKDNVWADLISRMMEDRRVENQGQIRGENKRLRRPTEKGKAYREELMKEGDPQCSEEEEEKKGYEEDESVETSETQLVLRRYEGVAKVAETVGEVQDNDGVGEDSDPLLPERMYIERYRTLPNLPSLYELMTSQKRALLGMKLGESWRGG
jgi:hypothetical protein